MAWKKIEFCSEETFYEYLVVEFALLSEISTGMGEKTMKCVRWTEF